MRRLIGSRVVRLVAGIAISAVFLAATVRQVDLGAAIRLLLEAQPAWILASIALVATEVVLRGARWRLLLLPFRPVPLRYATGYLCVGYFANTILPARLGDLARAGLAGRTLGIPQLATLGTIVVERLADGLTILVLVIGCGLIVTGASALVGTAVMLALAGTAALATILAVALVARILRVHETRHGAQLVGVLRRIAIGATALRRPSALAIILALTLAAFALAVAAFLATSTAVGIAISPLQAAVVMGGLALSTAIPAAPGSIGTYEFVGVTILTSFGVAPEAALATVLLAHAIALLVPSLAGLVTTWVLHFNVREVATVGPGRAARPADDRPAVTPSGAGTPPTTASSSVPGAWSAPAAPSLPAAPSVAVVIPAFNEEARLGATLAAIAAHGTRSGRRPPVVLADDGSTDGTAAVARRAGRDLGLDLAILGLPHAGKAWAVRSGMLHAAATSDAEHVLMLDADNEISVDHLADVPWAPDPATIYIGRRVGAVGTRTGARPTPFRRLMSLGMRILARLLLGLPYPDTQCGFKVFPRALVPGLFGQQRARGWVFDAEILVIARRSGFPIEEVPVVWSPRGTSRVRPSAALTSLAGIVGIAIRRARGGYRAVPRPPEQ